MVAGTVIAAGGAGLIGVSDLAGTMAVAVLATGGAAVVVGVGVLVIAAIFSW